MSKYWIVNNKTKEYIEIDNPFFDGEWKEQYPHVKNESYINILTFKLWEHDKIGKIYFIYDLGVNGAYFHLLIDRGKHTQEDIQKAKHYLKTNRDALKITVGRYTRYKEKPTIIKGNEMKTYREIQNIIKMFETKSINETNEYLIGHNFEVQDIELLMKLVNLRVEQWIKIYLLLKRKLEKENSQSFDA